MEVPEEEGEEEEKKKGEEEEEEGEERRRERRGRRTHSSPALRVRHTHTKDENTHINDQNTHTHTLNGEFNKDLFCSKDQKRTHTSKTRTLTDQRAEHTSGCCSTAPPGRVHVPRVVGQSPGYWWRPLVGADGCVM